MKKAMIIHQSKKGSTRKLGEDIGRFMEDKGIQTEIMPVSDYESTDLSGFDYIFLGCWTKGLMVIAQHPDLAWKKLAASLELPKTAKIGLFTTYKIATGSMFNSMRKSLSGSQSNTILKIKSRNGSLSADNADLLNQFISN